MCNMQNKKYAYLFKDEGKLETINNKLNSFTFYIFPTKNGIDIFPTCLRMWKPKALKEN